MAVAPDCLPAQQAALGPLTAFAGFLTALHGIESVRRVGVSSGGPSLDVWVLQEAENIEDARTIYGLDYDVRRSVGMLPIEVHVIPLSEVDRNTLPEMQVIFER